ncbi:MAG: asparagine synthase C-terminal domain-containing protein [Deltaproteobacteria bacterium]|nr:asparagine synthase C-terminal domain-containing protein [Deltaproteobacteria bacterium]
MGPEPAPPRPRPRPHRQEAAPLRVARRHAALRLRDQGNPHLAGLPTPRRSHRDPPLPHAPVRPLAVDRVRGRPHLAARAHLLTIEAGAASASTASPPAPVRYSRLPDPTQTRPRPRAELIAELGAQLDEAVRLRLISDVPLGAFLSGGVDSSAIVATMARVGGGRIKTFSIGFREAEYDETAWARQVAERYATDHEELVVEPDAADVIPKLVWHYGEPFADSSAVPTYYVSQIARRKVTVALNGDGGDESFLGYPRYDRCWAQDQRGRHPRCCAGSQPA